DRSEVQDQLAPVGRGCERRVRQLLDDHGRVAAAVLLDTDRSDAGALVPTPSRAGSSTARVAPEYR
ncbi:MAG TPA: hypothetical protein VF635_04360, partial [Propionibacteriaceae bacterium]